MGPVPSTPPVGLAPLLLGVDRVAFLLFVQVTRRQVEKLLCKAETLSSMTQAEPQSWHQKPCLTAKT